MVNKKKFTYNELSKNPRIVLFGKTQSGKSVLANYMCSQYSKNFKVIIFDTKNEYDFYKPLKIEDFKQGGFIRRAISIKYKQEIITDVRALEFLAGLLLRFKKTLLYIEEVPYIIPKHVRLYNFCPNTATTLLQGAKDYNGIVAVAQRPAELHLDFVTQTFDKFVFHVDPKDEKSVSDMIGIDVPFDEMEEFEFYSYRHKTIFKAIKPLHKYKRTIDTTPKMEVNI